MQWTRKLSLRRKITLLIMINTVAALCAAGIAFAEYGVQRFKQVGIQDLNALANILGTNCTAPLAFKDPNSARDILQALVVKPHILAAVIYDHEGKPFAVYHRGGSMEQYSAPPVESESSRFTSNRVLIFQAIVFDGEKVGTVFLEGGHGRIQPTLGWLFVLFRNDYRRRFPRSVSDGRAPATPDLESNPGAGVDHKDGYHYPGLFHSGWEAFGG